MLLIYADSIFSETKKSTHIFVSTLSVWIFPYVITLCNLLHSQSNSSILFLISVETELSFFKSRISSANTYRNPKNFLLCVFLISFCCSCHLSHLFPALCPVFRIKPSYDFHFLNHILITDVNFNLLIFINIDFIYGQCQQCAIQFFDFQ